MRIEWAKLFLTPFVYLAAAVVAILLIWFFKTRLRLLLTYLGIKAFKFAGIEISLSSAEIDKAEERALREGRIDEDELVSRAEVEIFVAKVAPYIARRRLLWVDDNPANNSEERQAFRLAGLDVENVFDTEEALQALCRDDYDLVVSDIGRGEIFGPCAKIRSAPAGDNGWKTLEEINKVFDQEAIPVIFYHGATKPDDKHWRAAEARRLGAAGETTSPATLYLLVISAVVMRVATKDSRLRHLIRLIPKEVKKKFDFHINRKR